LARAVAAAILILAVPAVPLFAQPTPTPTFAQPTPTPTSPGTAYGSALHGPQGVAVDSAGNVYVTGYTSGNAFKITPDGTITEIIDGSGDGTHLLEHPAGVAVDSADNVYVTGEGSNNAFKITPHGTVTQIIDFSGDGTNGLGSPHGVAVDSAGNVYVTGSGGGGRGAGASSLLRPALREEHAGAAGVALVWGSCVFKITPDGTITAIIDSTGDGTHGLGMPSGVAVDSADNVYVSGRFCNEMGCSYNVFQITPDGTITQIIESTGDGTNALYLPRAIAVDSAGNVYVTGYTSDNAFKITPDGTITQNIDSTGDGTNSLDGPAGVAVDSADSVYVTGYASDNAFKITPDGAITQIIDSSGAPPAPTPTLTPTPTPQPSSDDGGCAVTPIHSGAAWWLLVPALLLVWARRREGALRP